MAKKTAAPADGNAMLKFPKGENGPSPEEQAWADEQQRQIIDQIKAARAAAEAEERRIREEKQAKAQALAAERKAMSVVLADLVKRVEALERKG